MLRGTELQYAQHESGDAENHHGATEASHHAVDKALLLHDGELDAEGEQHIRRQYER